MRKYKIIKYRNNQFWFVYKRIFLFFWKDIKYFNTFQSAYEFVDKEPNYRNEPILIQVNKRNL